MAQKNFKTGWVRIDQTSDPHFYIRFMDRVRQQDDAPDQYRNVFEPLAAAAGEQVLDVGCGTGGAVRALARQVAGIGRVIGVDTSTTMIAEAEKRAADLGLPIAYQVADAHHLEFDDATFDGCYSIGVFEIIGEPQQALAEMIRVIRSGGRLVISGPDTDACMIDAADRDVTRKIIHYACDHETNGWIGRQLPGYCHELGLTNIQVVPWNWVLPNSDYNKWSDLWWRGWAERAQAAGVISVAEAADWFTDLEERHQAGRFLATWSGFTITARKP